jgi:hypothetical protein
LIISNKKVLNKLTNKQKSKLKMNKNSYFIELNNENDNDDDNNTYNLLELNYLNNSKNLSLLENILPLNLQTEKEFKQDYNVTNNWLGSSMKISDYTINIDENPEIIIKKPGDETKLEYIQELILKYLRPPTPPAPGEIIINQQVT